MTVARSPRLAQAVLLVTHWGVFQHSSSPVLRSVLGTTLMFGLVAASGCGARTFYEGAGPGDAGASQEQTPSIGPSPPLSTTPRPDPTSAPVPATEPRPAPEPPAEPPAEAPESLPPIAVPRPQNPDPAPQPPKPPITAPSSSPETCNPPVLLDFGPALSGTYEASLEGAADVRDWCGHGREVLFSWTAPETGHYAFDTLGTTFDATLAVLSVEADACGTLVTCDDDGAAATESLQAYVELHAQRGSRYLIAVEAYEVEEQGTFSLSVRRLDAANGLCEAITLDLKSASVSGNFEEDARATELESSCSSGNRAVLAQFTAPTDGIYTFDTHGSDFDTVLVVGPGCAVAPWRCNDDSLDGRTSSITHRLAEAQTAFLQVSAYRNVEDADPLPPLTDAGVTHERNYVLNVSRSAR